MPVENQVVIIYAAINGYLDDIKVDKIKEFETKLHEFIGTTYKSILDKIAKTKELDKKIEEELKKAIERFKKGLDKNYFAEKIKNEKSATTENTETAENTE